MSNEQTRRIMQAIQNSQEEGGAIADSRWGDLMYQLEGDFGYKAYPDHSTPEALEAAIGDTYWMSPYRGEALKRQPPAGYTCYQARLPGVSRGIKLTTLRVDSEGWALPDQTESRPRTELPRARVEGGIQIGCAILPPPSGLYLKDEREKGDWVAYIHGVVGHRSGDSMIVLGPGEEGEVVHTLCPGDPIPYTAISKRLPAGAVERLWAEQELPTTVREAKALAQFLDSLRIPVRVKEALEMGFEYALFE